MKTSALIRFPLHKIQLQIYANALGNVLDVIEELASKCLVGGAQSKHYVSIGKRQCVIVHVALANISHLSPPLDPWVNTCDVTA